MARLDAPQHTRPWNGHASTCAATLAFCIAALLIASPAHSRRDVSDARATIEGAGGRYTLTITNTGVTTIRCIRFRPAYPVELVELPRDAFDETSSGEQPRVVTAKPNLRPGATWRTVFRTKRPYPREAGGSLALDNPSYPVCFFPGRTIRVSGPPKR